MNETKEKELSKRLETKPNKMIELEGNFKEHWKHEDYRSYVLIQMSLYISGIQTASKTAEILHVNIRDIWGLGKKLDTLY